MCFDYDEDSVVIQRTRLVVARKEHRCDDCGGTIRKGESHTYGAWRNEGTIWGFRGCAACKRIRDEIYRREIAHGCKPYESYVPYGDGVLAEYLSEVGPEDAAAIRAAAATTPVPEAGEAKGGEA